MNGLSLANELRCREILQRGNIILTAGTVADGRIYTLTTDLLALVAKLVADANETRPNQDKLPLDGTPAIP